jgi:hypothetical protein
MWLDLTLDQTLLTNQILFVDSLISLATLVAVLGQFLFGSSFPMLFSTLSFHSSFIITM